jgi:hypothetical protein
MHINEVKTAIKIGEFVLRRNHPNKIDINYLPRLDENLLKDDRARVYLFVQDGIIKKIGGSSAKGGIKNTISFYVNAMQGSPGRPRFIIHLLIEQALKDGSKVEVYMITSPKTKARVNGLFRSTILEIASYKEMEDICKRDFYLKEGKYPDWNFQENNIPYPKELENKYLEYQKHRVSKRKK